MAELAESTASKTGKAVIVGALVSAAMALLGGALIHADGDSAKYGTTMFVMLPVVTGAVAGCLVKPLRASLVAIVLSLLVCIILLLVTGLEGIVCVLMASPLIVGGAIIGAVIGAVLRGLSREFSGPRTPALVAPVIGLAMLLASGKIENRIGTELRTEPFSTVANVQGDREQAWRRIISVEELGGDKPFLLRIGLPVPTSCTLEGHGVGARRICYFESGTIEEDVTDWDPPRRLEMTITRSTLPGRHWLGFATASYTLEESAPGETRITRTTTIRSQLRPGWYWRRFEAMGVEAEHRYLFQSLDR